MYPFERDSKHSNVNSNHSNGAQIIWTQIWTFRKRFGAFEYKFQSLQKDSKHSNPNSNFSKGIRSTQIQILTIRQAFKAFKCKFEPFEPNWKHSNKVKWDSKHWNPNSNYSKGIQSIRMPIESIQIQSQTIQKGLEEFERDSKHSNPNSKHLNPNSNYSKGIQSIRMPIQSILTIRSKFDIF